MSVDRALSTDSSVRPRGARERGTLTGMDVVAVLAELGGVARTRELMSAGCSHLAIRRAVDGGAAARVRKGLIALPDGDPALTWAVHLGGELTCVSALARHGVDQLRRSSVAHVGVASGFTTAQRRVRGVRLHYTKGRASLSPSRVASVARALDDAGRCLDERAHLVAVDSALHRGLVVPADIAAMRASGRARRDWLLACMDGRAESPGESLARLDCVERGLAVHPQRFIAGVGRVDLVVEDQVVVEVDGRAHHSDPEAFVRDRRRGRRVVGGGMPVLRFAAMEMLGTSPVDVGAEVEAFLGRRFPRTGG